MLALQKRFTTEPLAASLSILFPGSQ